MEPLITIIKPKSGWQLIDFKELKDNWDLLYSLVWRDIQAHYAQTIMGLAWTILQPLIQILLFSIVFGKIARISTDGIPYLLFSTVAIIPWTYMSTSMSLSSDSLVRNSGMLGKIYFPRLLFPLTPILSKLIDFSISMLIILLALFYYRIAPTWNLLVFPFCMLLMISLSTGIGLWTAATAIRFRDVRFAMPFVVRMAMYTAPIVYSASAIPDSWRFLYSFNPIVGVIEGFRACFLGTPMPWNFIWPGILTNVLILISGALYFKRIESIFVDVI